jgi:hypothetical protein
MVIGMQRNPEDPVSAVTRVSAERLPRALDNSRHARDRTSNHCTGE